MKRAHRIRLIVLATVLIAGGVARLLETRRLGVPLPREVPAAGRPARLDSERMLLDLRILALHPDEVVIVSAHVDHLGVVGGQAYHGADDNASGVAALLALAAYVKAHQPERTVVFAAFDAEEFGLRGSRTFVRPRGCPPADRHVRPHRRGVLHGLGGNHSVGAARRG